METKLDQMRLMLLIPALELFAGAAHQVLQHRHLVEQNRILMLEGRHLPPTMIGSPLALAVTLSALGCVLLVVALRKKRFPTT
jgi:hypothetical protein